jgi:hypothetical protein
MWIRFRANVDKTVSARVQRVSKSVANDLPRMLLATAVKCNKRHEPSIGHGAVNEPLERRSTIHPSVTLPPR